MKKRTLNLIIFLVCITSAFAQKKQLGKIMLKVVNQQQQPLENVTAELLRMKDSSLVKMALSDKAGSVEFENILLGDYIIRINLVNYEHQYSSAITLSVEQPLISHADIELLPAIKQLKTVEITGRKTFIQRMSDRIVVNVYNSVINAGSSAFDVLERSSGILIDANDNLSIRGRAGVIIMIDGKPSPVSEADLVNYLHSLPSNAIERIDLITNPSSKYDAAGNAGIIDIRMKKDQRYGANGSVTAGYGQGVYPKAKAGVNFNHRNKRMNLFGGYNYAYRMNLNHLLLDRNFFSNGQFTGKVEKDNYTKIPLKLNTFRIGADFFTSKRTMLAFVINSNVNYVLPFNNNNSVVSDASKQPVFTFNTQTNNKHQNQNTVANFNVDEDNFFSKYGAMICMSGIKKPQFNELRLV